MKKVWKCDFCSYMSVDPLVIQLHEAGCDLNPESKKCPTCADEICDEDGETSCLKDYHNRFDTKGRHVTCPYWEKIMYQCRFCDKVDEDPMVIELHEKTCKGNK